MARTTKLKSEKRYDITARTQGINCPKKGDVIADFTAGTFKSSVVIGEITGSYYLFVDNALDQQMSFARISALTDLEGNTISGKEMNRVIIDNFLGKDHDVVITGFNATDSTMKTYEISADLLTKQEVASKEKKEKNVKAATGRHEKVMLEHTAEMVKLGAMSQEVADAIISTLRENRILDDVALCEQLYKYWKTHWEKFGNKDPKKPSVPRPIYKDPALDEYIKDHNEGIISEGLRCALSGHGLVAQGGKSVGKNVWSATIAMLLNVPYSLLTFSRSMAPSAIYGEKSTDNTASEHLYSNEARELAVRAVQGNINEMAEFELMKARAATVRIIQDQSELFDALQYGRVMIFNEMNMADPNLFASFVNQILDGTGFLFIPGRGEVEIPREFVFIGTQNEDYEGVEQQNEATMSRLAAITFPQPKTILPQLEAAVEAEIAKNGICEIDEEFKKKASKAYKQIENYYDACKSMSVDDGKTSFDSLVSEAVLNIRGFIRATVEYLEAGGYTTLKRKIEMHVIGTCPVDERNGLKTILSQYVTV